MKSRILAGAAVAAAVGAAAWLPATAAAAPIHPTIVLEDDAQVDDPAGSQYHHGTFTATAPLP
jgi:hypothetical protein